MPEPKTDQKVAFILKRNDSSKRTFGVVLKVNGESTLYKQKDDALQCRKWIIEPGDGTTTIKGFKTAEQTGEAFRVLSREESKKNEINYGEDVGTIQMVVFANRVKNPEPTLVSEAEEDLQAVKNGGFPADLPEGNLKPPESNNALKQQLTWREAW